MGHNCIECQCPLDERAINGMCLKCYIAQINLMLDGMAELVQGQVRGIRHALLQVENATRK